MTDAQRRAEQYLPLVGRSVKFKQALNKDFSLTLGRKTRAVSGNFPVPLYAYRYLFGTVLMAVLTQKNCN